ncbi:hypothetical protein J2Y58_002510 [Sphingomonas sp. BE138]|uniref:hypothetical protein n=1 Tax=Sphingomonas sp. BE138 TaxID=2817845 RepID=UPI002862552D|nr:hypothetical protein [Sphingomonas sp. BE138]MDR6789139.1 hypothetical protein [Sphingomonas sp. BE138]
MIARFGFLAAGYVATLTTMEDSAVQPIERDTRPQSLEDVERSMRRITDRYTWKRVFLFAALFIWLFNAYAAQPYVDGRSYIAVWVVACIGCWTASGWLLDLPRLMFPEVEAFRHLRRPAPRQ